MNTDPRQVSVIHPLVRIFLGDPRLHPVDRETPITLVELFTLIRKVYPSFDPGSGQDLLDDLRQFDKDFDPENVN